MRTCLKLNRVAINNINSSSTINLCNHGGISAIYPHILCTSSIDTSEINAADVYCSHILADSESPHLASAGSLFPLLREIFGYLQGGQKSLVVRMLVVDTNVGTG